MNKFIKKCVASSLAFVMLLSCSISAQAEELNIPEDNSVVEDTTPIVEDKEPIEEDANKNQTEPTSETPVTTTEARSTEQIVSIPDATLKGILVADYDENGDGELSTSEMATITSLDIVAGDGNGPSISMNLSGLEYAVNLEEIKLARVKVQDFSALSQLSHLACVFIGQTTTANIPSLAASCPNLQMLIINMSDVTDIFGIGSMTQLKTLNLYANGITDISDVASLVNLESLVLDATGVSDLTPAAACKKLKELSITGSTVTDLAPVAQMPNLESLSLGYDLNLGQGITDISPLASCSNLKKLTVMQSSITEKMLFETLVPDEQNCTLTVGSKNDISLFKNNCEIIIQRENVGRNTFGAKDVAWSSSNPAVVDVTEDFCFEAKQVGTAEITATFEGVSKVFNITVSDITETVQPTTEFSGTTSDLITVSAADVSVISRNALTFLQRNYSEQLAQLGDNYKVVASLDLTELKPENVDQQVKDAFNTALNGMTVGQYYDISIFADVVKNGQMVEGLENITIPSLDTKITLNLQVPTSLRKDGRTYAVLHYHDKKAETLSSKTNNSTVSFQTDAFSPYTLTYKDATKAATVTVSSVSPRTGDTTDLIITMILALMSLGILSSMLVYRKHKRF